MGHRGWAGRVVRRVLTAVLAGSVLVLLAVGIGPRLGLYQVLTVLSGSMEPELPAGSLVVVTPKPLHQVKLGDVIVYHAPSDGRPIAHRVVEVVEKGHRPLVRTKGDANVSVDPWLARLQSEPAWEVRGALPGVGSAVLWLRQPMVRQGAVLAASLALMVIWLYRIWRPEPTRAESTEDWAYARS